MNKKAVFGGLDSFLRTDMTGKIDGFKLGSVLVINQERLDFKLHKGFQFETVRTLRVTAFSPDGPGCV